MAFADLGDVRLFYTDDGAGEPALLFVHGYSCDSHDWMWQLPHFATTHRVIAVDLRGHGRSSAPDDGYTTAQFADDLARLLDLLDVDRVIAFGHSLGGAVAASLAVEHPDKVEAMVGVDPAYLFPDALGDAMAPMLEALAAGDPVPLLEQAFAGFEAPGWTPPLRTWHLRRMAGVPAHVLRQAFREQVSGMALHSVSAPYLARRTCPVLSVYADPDRVPVEEAVFSDARSRALAWPGACHWLQQERPDEFNALVDGWLASLRA